MGAIMGATVANVQGNHLRDMPLEEINDKMLV
jgi:hypothetical protein